MAIRLSCARCAAISHDHLLGPLAKRERDYLSQIIGGGIRQRIHANSKRWITKQNNQLRRLLLVSSATHGDEASAHAWGIAIDLNPETNQQGTAGNMDYAVITAFREAGFKWGGDWTGKSCDPMHFQFCTGY